MPAVIKRLETRPERLKREQAELLRGMLYAFPGGLPERALGELLLVLDRCTPAAGGEEWPFVMISPDQHAAVVRWLGQHSQRPQLAMQLWAVLFTHLRRDTGEVVRSREELAEELGVTPNHISRVMSELEQIGAISRELAKVPGMRGRGVVRYYMNPRVGTHLAGEARRKAQAEAPKLALVE
jgi:Crp-like helix-turn-helix domain